MIRRLRVQGYKSLANCSIDLAPLSVILGPNGAGKSNLLDIIGLLSRLASRETVREAFDGHRGRPLEAFHAPRGFGEDAYRETLNKQELAFTVECDLDLHPQIVQDVNLGLEKREKAVEANVTYTRVSETRLRYSVRVAMHPRSGELFISEESLRPLRQDYQPKAGTVRRPFFERERANDGSLRFVARVERQGHPRYFEGYRARTLLSELSDPVYHPHIVATAREISSWRVYYVEPTRMRADVPVQSADEPGRSGELLAAYYYALQQKQPATLKGIIRNLKDLVSGLEDLRVEAREGLLEVVTSHVGGAQFPARLLSEGTLRLLCLLGIAVAPNPPAVVVYEEPENGVNPARLDLLTSIIRNAVEVRPQGSQFILTTHSSAVCELLPEHLILCGWDASHGTLFKTFPWDRDSIFFQKEIIEALDGALESGQ